MGVPAFFRWLTKKYSSVIVHCEEQKSREIDGVKVPVDTSEPNPNGIEFDNLYLDMNGIIHPCTHPEDRPAPKNEDEMMVAIFDFVDRIFAIVRPRKLLYMAIDGVAPRAKMNQQRSRRFRASKESCEKMLEVNRIREELKEKGIELPPEKPKESHFDSNCITPGTPFMDRLSKCLHYYIHDRLMHDPGWKNIQIILSDANVPGEGEHKIMDYIRRQRAFPDHDPNTHHVLCGADADLIMLGLATHEPNFTIIREEFRPNRPAPCDICGQLGHEMKDCMGGVRAISGEFDEIEAPIATETNFIFVRLCVLREYLERELHMPNLPFPYDFERALDDWVFMCFFVGNDFLPHLPSLEIREGAIDRLVVLYKKTVTKTKGYVTSGGLVNIECVQMILSELGKVEDEIFRQRQAREKAYQEREKQKKRRAKMEQGRPSFMMGGQYAPMAVGHSVNPINDARREAYSGRVQSMNYGSANYDAAAALKASLLGNSAEPNRGVKRPAEDSSDEEEEVKDEVRLWDEGFKDRYYESKFNVAPTDLEFRTRVARDYAYGLCWVLRYYYQGCPAWNWYFPYHYAPFASDFSNLLDMDTNFIKGTVPFQPLEQLMGVFPAASRSHVPEPFAKLMIDPHSTIIDFYPEDFKIDLNGKKFAWQGVALLPFVCERRLRKALAPLYELLDDDEKRRNALGKNRIYAGRFHKGYDFLKGVYEGGGDASIDFPLNATLFFGMSGTVRCASDYVKPGCTVYSPVKDLPDLEDNSAICTEFDDPYFEEHHIFSTKRLEGATDPPRVLKPPGTNSNDREGGWRPTIGMTMSTTQASIDRGGHRALRTTLNIQRFQGYSQNPARRRDQNESTSYSAQSYQYEPNKSYERRSFDSGYKSQQQGYNQNRYQPYNQQGSMERSHSDNNFQNRNNYDRNRNSYDRNVNSNYQGNRNYQGQSFNQNQHNSRGGFKYDNSGRSRSWR